MIARDYVAPRLIGREIAGAGDVDALSAHIRGHNMARGGVEAAVWDLQARRNGNPLWKEIGGGARREIPCGVSIGIQDSVEQLIEKIEIELAAGYQRIKMKIKPGWDVDVIRRDPRALPCDPADGGREFGVHAGRCGAPEAAGRVLSDDDRAAAGARRHHRSRGAAAAARDADLSRRMYPDRRIMREQAIAMKAGRIINIKLGRVGGFGEAKRVHDTCEAAGIPVWCGGMLEAGIGRAHNIALATLPNFTLPGDVSASNRYWKRDIISPAVEITPQRNDRGSRRAGIRLRDRPRFHAACDGARGNCGLSAFTGLLRRIAITASTGSGRWSAKSATTSTTSR